MMMMVNIEQRKKNLNHTILYYVYAAIYETQLCDKAELVKLGYWEMIATNERI